MFEERCGERVMVKFSGKSEYILDQGIGINWHQNWYPENAPRDSTPPIKDEEHWQILLNELSFVQPACIRFGYQSRHFVDDQGKFNWNAEGFAALKKLNIWAKKNGASLCFDPWAIPKYYAFGLGQNNIFYDAPKDISKFTEEFVVPLIKHIVQDMKLETVTHFILMNEPLLGGSGTYLTPEGIDRFEHYVNCHRAIFEALDKKGLNIKLIGPDTWSSFYGDWAVTRFNERGLDLSPYIDAYDAHHYYGRLDYLPPNPQMTRTLPLSDIIMHHIHKMARFAIHKGKRFYITEMGTFYYGWGKSGDPYGGATHEAFITEVEFVIRALQVGCGGFFRWAFLAPGEYGDGVWQFINTVDGSYTRQPHTFYGYAMLMRYTAKNAVIWSPAISQKKDPYEYVQVVGLEMPDGTRTILIVNSHNCQEKVLELRLPNGWHVGQWQKLLDDRTRKMVRSNLSISSELIEDILPPMSLTVYTTRKMPGDEKLVVDNRIQPSGKNPVEG